MTFTTIRRNKEPSILPLPRFLFPQLITHSRCPNAYSSCDSGSRPPPRGRSTPQLRHLPRQITRQRMVEDQTECEANAQPGHSSGPSDPFDLDQHLLQQVQLKHIQLRPISQMESSLHHSLTPTSPTQTTPTSPIFRLPPPIITAPKFIQSFQLPSSTPPPLLQKLQPRRPLQNIRVGI